MRIFQYSLMKPLLMLWKWIVTLGANTLVASPPPIRLRTVLSTAIQYKCQLHLHTKNCAWRNHQYSSSRMSVLSNVCVLQSRFRCTAHRCFRKYCICVFTVRARQCPHVQYAPLSSLWSIAVYHVLFLGLMMRNERHKSVCEVFSFPPSAEPLSL